MPFFNPVNDSVIFLALMHVMQLNIMQESTNTFEDIFKNSWYTSTWEGLGLRWKQMVRHDMSTKLFSTYWVDLSL